jgi:hypothetical protein
MTAGQSELRLVRRSARALVFLAVIGGLFLLTFADAAWLRSRRAPGARSQAELAKRLGLTDLCLFTEARYTRHLSQADRHSAFQEHPGAFEHFPSGSLVSPPEPAKRHANLD